MKFCNDLLGLNPGDAETYLQRAGIYMQLAKYGEARADYEKAHELRPDDSRIYEALVSYYRSCPDVAYRDLNRALVHANRAADLAPQDPGTLWRLALVHKALGNYEKARPLFVKVIALLDSIEHSGNYAFRSTVFSQLGEHRQALADALKAVELGPQGHFNHLRVADVYLALGEPGKALAPANRALELCKTPSAPTSFRYYDTRAEVLIRLQKYDSALTDLNKSIELGPFRSYSHKRRGLVHFRLKKYAEALADIAKAVELKPDDLSALTWIPAQDVASCPDEAFRQGILALADKALELNEGSADAYLERGAIYTAMGMPDKALADLTIALELRPDDAMILHHRAHAHEAKGDLDQAIVDFNVAVRFDPQQPNLRYCRTLARLVSGDVDGYQSDCAGMADQFGETEDADNAYWTAWTCALAADAVADYSGPIGLAQKAVKSDPASSSRLNTLGAILYRAGQLDEAIQRLTEAEKLAKDADPKSKCSPAYHWFFLAMAHHRLGQHDEAKKWYDKAVEWTDKVMQEHEKGTGPRLSWNRRMTLKLLRQEAEKTLTIGDDSEPKTEKPNEDEPNEQAPAPAPA